MIQKLVGLIILSIADLILAKGVFWAYGGIDNLTPVPAFCFFCCLVCLNWLVIDIIEKVAYAKCEIRRW